MALTRYGTQGASSRVRFQQYLPALRTAGLEVQVAAMFSDEYVSGLQAGHRSVVEIVKAYTRRALHLTQVRRFDLLWIEKEALPWLPAWLELGFVPRATPIVLDYDDAVFHLYDQHRSRWVRQVLAGKHPLLMRRAAMVVVGNAYLADFAREAGARRVEVVPTAIDLERYPVPCTAHRSSHPPSVGWIGQRSTAPFLARLAPVFQRLSATGQARFTAVGIDALAMALPMESVPWTEDTEVASISRFDIGIMPLPDEPFERGKCGYKLVQYMAAGLPVVASPVGVNRQIVEHGVNGFLAETEQEWEQALTTLLHDSELRLRMGRAGRQKVEQQYCIQVTGPRLASALVAVAERAKTERAKRVLQA